MSTVEVKVPNIGDFKDVEVVELLVKAGDTFKVDQSLITVESDKASMEIPSTHAGVIKGITVKVGDKVNEGTMLLTLDEGAASAGAPAAAAAPAAEAKPAAQAVAPTAASMPTDSYAPAHPAPAASVAAAPAPGAASYSGQVDVE